MSWRSDAPNEPPATGSLRGSTEPGTARELAGIDKESFEKVSTVVHAAVVGHSSTRMVTAKAIQALRECGLIVERQA